MKILKFISVTMTVIAVLLFKLTAFAQGIHQTAQTKFVVVKGEKFAYRKFGNGSGVPLVFFQHFTGTMDNWDPALTNGFAKTHKVILFDNMGIGSSTGVAPSSITEMSEEAVAFLTAMHLSKVDVVGFSIGGFITQQIAIDHPGLIRKMILAGTGPRGGDITDNQPVIENKEKRTGSEQLLYLFFTQTPNSQQKGKEFLQRMSLRRVNRDANTKVASILAQNDAINKYKSEKDLKFSPLAKINIPVLVVNGVHDTMVPSINSYTLETHIKNSKLILYPDAGHGGLFQYHDDFVKQSNAFLQ
jgi:pimeloyl-ACP methyl ester carboxylesterase